MANNNIALITKYSTEAQDLVYKQESVTSVLDNENPEMVQFTGAKTVKIGKFANGGLYNYYRNNIGDARVPAPSGSNFIGAANFGYQTSALQFTWEEFTLRQDRAASFQIEEFDNEEVGGKLVALASKEIVRTTMVPEVDAYCLSTLAGYTNTVIGNRVAENIVNGTPSSNQENPIAALNKGILFLKKHEVPLDDMIAFCSSEYMNKLRQTSESGVYKPLTQGDLGKEKDVSFEITKYMGITLIETAPDRLRTNIQILNSGNGGYYWPTTADVADSSNPFYGKAASNEINFLIVSKKACMHIVKFEKVRVVDGLANLAGRGFDGYSIFARIYHDIFVPDNKQVALYCSEAYTNVAAPGVTLNITLDDNSDIKTMAVIPGNVFGQIGTYTGSSTAPDVGDTIAAADFKAAFVGDHVTASTAFYLIGIDRKVIAKATVTP